jgi:trimeric autotransporter adhesin
MKYTFYFLLLFFTETGLAQNVGIGTNTPVASAQLEINSASKGLLIPRVNLLSPTDVVTVPAPVPGLLLISLNNNVVQMPDGAGFYVWTGANWTKLLLKENGNATSGWTTRGNTGTNATDNFLGTTDKIPLVFKINNGFAGKIDTSGSVSFGRGAMQNTQPDRINTAFGDSALFNNSSNDPNLVYASTNTAIGNKALYTNATGDRNTAVGHNALMSNIDARANTAVGWVALRDNENGEVNSAFGHAALASNTNGSSNTALGANALSNNLTGNDNVAVGYLSAQTNKTGNYNITIGVSALNQNKSGSGNTVVGYEALYFDTTGFSNVAIGNRALYNAKAGSNLVAIGDSALYNQNNLSTQNTAVGSKAMYSLIGGFQNTSLGYQAAYNTNNNFGTYLGYQAGRNTSGVSNTYIGWGAGTDALVPAIQTGGDNVCIGVRAGQAITTGTQNIAIGNVANISTGTFSNTITIGHTATNTQSNSVVLGNAAITKWGFGVNAGAANVLEFNAAVTTARLTAGGVWTNASDKFLKTNFTALDKKEILNSIMQLPILRWNYLKEINSNTHIGPMAQDFYRLFNTGNDDKTISTIDPAGVALIGVQQLKNEIDELKKEIAQLKKIIKASAKK